MDENNSELTMEDVVRMEVHLRDAYRAIDKSPLMGLLIKAEEKSLRAAQEEARVDPNDPEYIAKVEAAWAAAKKTDWSRLKPYSEIENHFKP